MKLKTKSKAAPQGEPWSEYEKIEFVRGYSGRVWNNWEQDHPEFQIRLTPAESTKLDRYLMVVDGEEVFIERDKRNKLLDKILKRVKRDYRKWEKINRPERGRRRFLEREWDDGAYTR